MSVNVSTKPTRTFIVCTGPIAIPHGEDYELVLPPKEHTIRGKEVKGQMIATDGHFQIIDHNGTVVFSCPTHQVIWCRVVQNDDGPAPKIYNVNPQVPT